MEFKEQIQRILENVPKVYEAGRKSIIVQETGYGEGVVMSQKATTEELERMSRRVEILEHVSNNTLYKDVDDEGKAKEVVLPDGVLPYGSITSVGGASYLRIRNVLPFPYALGTMAEDYNGVFREVHPDGSFTLNGVATSNMSWYLITKSMKWVTEPGKYFFSGCPNGGSLDSFYLETTVHKNDNFLAKWKDTGNSTTCDTSGLDYNQQTFCIVIKAGARFDNVTFYPQLEPGDKKTEFEPYTVKPTAVRYITVKGRNRAILEPTGTGADIEFGSNYFKVKKKGSSYYASMYINGLKPNTTYTMFLKTDIPSDEYGMYPNLSLNGTSQLRFNSGSVFRRTFTSRDGSKRDRMTVYFNGATAMVATTYIEIVEGVANIPEDELFAPIHEDYIYEIPEAIRNIDGYGHGIYAVSESGSVLNKYNYVNFDEGAYYKSVYSRAYKNNDSSDWRYITDGVTTIYGDNDGKVETFDISEHIPQDGVIIPLVSSDTIIFSEELGKELPLPVSYEVKYQVKV